MERDHTGSNPVRGTIISTHTLTWSVTGEMNVQTYKKCISTHTLTWSVTRGGETIGKSSLISTHTLTWSVTGGGSNQGTAENDFNSHAHVERDSTGVDFNGIYGISTHTLTWSVTYVQIRQFLGQQTFQLTRSRGA